MVVSGKKWRKFAETANSKLEILEQAMQEAIKAREEQEKEIKNLKKELEELLETVKNLTDVAPKKSAEQLVREWFTGVES